MTQKSDPKWVDALKQRWGVHSKGQVLIILVVFAITGTSTMFINRFLFQLIGVGPGDAWYIYWPLKVISILVVYNILLLIVGAIFGQYDFFLRFEKRFFSRLLFLKSKS